MPTARDAIPARWHLLVAAPAAVVIAAVGIG